MPRTLLPARASYTHVVGDSSGRNHWFWHHSVVVSVAQSRSSFSLCFQRRCLAQGASTSTVNGVVRDASGQVLPGVTVEAASPALIEKVRSTVTDERGEYRLLRAAARRLLVTFSLSGFSTLKRDGLELRTNFTAQVDVELKVSQLRGDDYRLRRHAAGGRAGRDPAADGHARDARHGADVEERARHRRADPAVVEPPNSQDVGGSKGERSVRISVHGGKTYDSRLLQDGMRYNALTPGIGTLEGTGRGYYANPLAVQEVVVDLGTMGSAEYSLGGAQVNSIPKDGGNRFSGSLFVAGTGRRLQSNNLDDDLRQPRADVGQPRREGLRLQRRARRTGAQGSRCGSSPPAGTGARRPASPICIADSNTSDFLYTPDLSSPIEPEESNRGGGGRLTLQATPRNKFTFS